MFLVWYYHFSFFSQPATLLRNGFYAENQCDFGRQIAVKYLKLMFAGCSFSSSPGFLLASEMNYKTVFLVTPVSNHRVKYLMHPQSPLCVLRV
jgi:hypothetical protein